MAEGEEIEFEQRPSGHLALTATSDDLVSATSGAQAPPPPEPQGEEKEGEPKKAGEAKKEEKKKLVNGLNNAVEMMAKYTDIVVETNGENAVWLGSEEDAELFREIKVWRKENPESTVEEALKHFVTDREGGLGTKADALAKVAYNSRDVDYVIKFEDRGRFGNIRVAWERKLVKAGLVLELESEFDPKETFVKVFTPFSVMAREAERKSLRMPLCAEADPYKRQRQEQEQRDREAGILPPGGEGAQPEEEEEEAHGPSTLGPRPSGMEDVNLPTPEGAKGKATSEPGRRRPRRRSLWAEVRTFFSLNEHMAPGASGRFSLEDIGEFMGGDDLVACEGTSPKERLVLEFFPRSKRNLLTYYLITKIFLTPVELREIDNPYVQTQHSFGINHALKHGAYTHFFPLHDGSHSTKHRKKNLRAWLKSRWCLSPFSFQPLDTVRDYFGEKIALYFAFLGFYTVWLWPAALAGLLSFFYGISYAVSQTKLQLSLDSVTELDTIQRSTGRVFDNPATIPFAAFMCVWATLFVEFWKRKNSFLAYWWDTMNYEQSEMPRPEWYGTKVRVSPITGKKEYYYPEQVRNAKMAASCVCISAAIIIILFSVMCTVVYTAWATNYFGECFIPDVERAYCVELLSEYRGVTLNATCSDPCYSIPDRPTCEAGTFELDGATFQSCLWFDLAGDEPRNPGNLTGLCAPGCETVPRGIPCTADPAHPDRGIRSSCGWRDKYMISDITTSLFNLFVIVVMNKIFEYAAYVLNDWENHKTLTLWEDSLITKTFFFQFLNSYTTLFYIAFFKGTVAKEIFGRQDLRDTCEYGSCFNEVMIQLAIVFVGKQVINQFIEIALPWLKKSLRGKLDERQARNLQLRYEEIQQAKAAKDPHATPPQWVQDQNLDSYQSVLFDDYNEMALQFGFITLFVAAFPLAPFFALLNNLVEIRTDSYKLIVSHQRPPALQAKDIGNWQTILNVLGIMAVITNAFMIAFTSDWVTQTLEELSIEHSWREILAGRLVIVLVFEHVVIGLKVLCSLLVPDTPAPVKLAIDRENYLARLALEGITEEEDADGEVDLMNNLFSDVIHNVRRAQDSTNAHINAWSKK